MLPRIPEVTLDLNSQGQTTGLAGCRQKQRNVAVRKKMVEHGHTNEVTVEGKDPS